MSRCSKCKKYVEEPSLYLQPSATSCQCNARKYYQYLEGNLYPPVRYGDKSQFYSEKDKYLQSSPLYGNGNKYLQDAGALYSDQENYLDNGSRYADAGNYQPAQTGPIGAVAGNQPPRHAGEAIMAHHRNEDRDHNAAWMVVGHHLNWARGVNPAAEQPPAGVRYLRSDAERAPFKIAFDSGMLLWGGARMDTTSARVVLRGQRDKQVMGRITGAFIYVMSVDGDFYAADAAAEYKKGGVFNMQEFKVPVNNTRNLAARFEGREAVNGRVEGFHHSSFMEGQEVASAGEIYVREGKLLKIDNNSGHYVPAPVTMLAVADSLERNGINVEQVEFGYNQGGGMKFAPIKYWLGRRAYLGARSQWPEPVPK